jgi:lysyl-tRNA synthetase, class II
VSDDASDAGSTSPEDIHRLVKARLEKVERIRASGLDPYANDFKPELSCKEFHERFGAGQAAELEKIQTVLTVAGRVMTRRDMGKANFLTIRDASGDLQIYVKKDRVGEKTFEHLKLMDIGDFIGVAGTPMRTKTGELTIAADGFRILTKSLRPLPDKFHGLADVEQRYRHRYVDLIVNPEVRRVFKARHRVVRGIQAYLDKRGFLEVETPILQDLAGGATAKPFGTHHNALGQDLYLRIATELHLKRLVVGGLERVYEIGRNFRNEGVSTRHNPEFTSIEIYQSYATYTDLMDLTEDMVCQLIDEIHDREKLPYAEREVDFKRPWRRAPIAQLVGEHLKVKEDLTGIDSVHKALSIVDGHCVAPDEPLFIVLKELSDSEAEQLVPGIAKGAKGSESVVERARAAFKAAADKRGFYDTLGKNIDLGWPSPRGKDSPFSEEEVTLKAAPSPLEDDATGEISIVKPTMDDNRVRRRRVALALLYAVFDHEVERTLTNPTFITDFSVSVSPLARRRDNDAAVVDRFELIVAGMELANAFSELNDPVDQRTRFEAQLREKERGDAEAHEMDEDFIHALEVGMPPTAGLGIGIDRLVMVLNNQTSIRDVILFPQMRREQAK